MGPAHGRGVMKRKRYNWELPEKITERLGESTYGRQRTIHEDDHLLLILHAPPGEDDTSRECVVFLRKPDGRWLCNGADNGELRLRRLVKNYQDLFNDFDERYEQATDADDLFAVLEPLTPVARAAMNMHVALQSARDQVKDDAFIILMRDEAYELSRNYELLFSDAKIALDFRMAQHAERQSAQAHAMAEAQHKLNLLAAVTFPLMSVAALFGMNLVHGYENEPPIVFWLVLGIGVIIGIYTQKWVTRKRT